VDRVRGGPVETGVLLVIHDVRLVGLDDLFCFLKRVELPLESSTVKRLNPLDLARIEDARVSENGSFKAIGTLYFLMGIRIFFCPGRSA
jgi:hypothetical protein